MVKIGFNWLTLVWIRIRYSQYDEVQGQMWNVKSKLVAFFQRLVFYGHLEAFSGKVQENWPCLTFVFTLGNMFLQFMEVPGGCPGASKHWSSKIFLNKTSFRGLGPPPLNAGQVLYLDLCATLGVSLAALLSYMVLKLKEIMGGLYNFNV